MNGYEIGLIVAAIALAIMGGLLKHFVNLIRQSGELLTNVADAFADGKVTKVELVGILKEAKDVGDVWIKIVSLCTRKK